MSFEIENGRIKVETSWKKYRNIFYEFLRSGKGFKFKLNFRKNTMIFESLDKAESCYNFLTGDGVEVVSDYGVSIYRVENKIHVDIPKENHVTYINYED